MEKIIRIKKINIKNIKNVLNGELLLDVEKDNFGSSIVGIYGQNGSGKTAVIWAFDLIKCILSGEKPPKDTFFYINKESEIAEISINFSYEISQKKYDLFYTLKISKESEYFNIENEMLEYSLKGDELIKKTKILEFKNSDKIEEIKFFPSFKINEMASKNKTFKSNLLAYQIVSSKGKTSYLFSKEMMELFEKNLDVFSLNVLKDLNDFAKYNMFVLNKNSDSLYNMNVLPLSLRYQQKDKIYKFDQYNIGLRQNEASLETFNIILKVINKLDTIIQTIIPNLDIEVNKISEELNEKGERVVIFELVSKRNDILIPLRYESEGIKKILCILSSLISMYNNPSIFVAIDELDSGVFEYLLGELLQEIDKFGKGQLLFTSHNMRPLEVLDKENIYFSTVNPKNKYIRFSGVKETNNLRNMYLRAIDLGGQKEVVYESTSPYKISKAFRKAGKIDE